MISDEAIKRAAHTLAARAQSPAKVILFGSRARGESAANSDLDFLVVEEEVDDTIQEAARLRRALPPLGVAVDVLAISAEDAERRRRWPGNVVKIAFREGKLLAES